MDAPSAPTAKSAQIRLIVGEGCDARGVGTGPSLLTLANTHGRVTLGELRSLNQELDGLSADEPIPIGTAVRMPFPLMDQRRIADADGSYFPLGSMEERLRRTSTRLDALVSHWRGGAVAAPPPTLPHRRLRSQMEQLREVVDAEVARQLPSVAARYEAGGQRDTQLPYLVEATVVKARATEIARAAAAGVRLRCFDADRAAPQGALLNTTFTHVENALCEPDLLPVPDTEADTCAAHTHRWEVVLMRSCSDAFMEEWAVLACQRLTSFLDAVQATCLASTERGSPVPTTQDAMLYIGGVFYVDDRHSDHRDPSAEIRRQCAIMLAEGTLAAEEAGPNVFAHCPVRSASTTRWADVSMRQRELCVVHHLGGCTHYFYLKGPRSLAPDGAGAGLAVRRRRDEYPHRTAKRKEMVTSCQLCRVYPSTIAVFYDPLSPTNPAHYCSICHHLIHGDDKDASKPYVEVRPRNPGGYFTY